MTELQRRRPAAVRPQVVDARVIPAPAYQDLETWTDQRYALLARLKKATARGEIREAGAWRAVPGLTGWYSVEVRRLKEPTPIWKRVIPWALVGIAGLAGVGAAIVWAVSALVASLAAVPIVVWVLLGVLLLGGGGGTVVTVVTKVTVK